MPSVLIIAHGSRRQDSNNEISMLADKVATHLPHQLSSVHIAFLEFAKPSITDAINECFNNGIDDLLVLPYFLSAGNHVTNDIPETIEALLPSWPNKKLTLLPHIGALEQMATLIANACLPSTMEHSPKGT
ncbi:MAG: CbiX/SirB N-terminal domain-containing protein [Gammaproteobacteria bacterium]|jgi:sirohydrochlorin ferrochelatase|nr:CbiX/SirB N-terminal domain-containing protein [Gammaproteobacteria bacterium]